jgi:hypothetical protein
MKNLKSLPTVLSLALALACLHVSVSGQTTDDKNRLANITANGSSVRWDVSAPHAGLTVTISAPDGQVFRKEFRAGASPDFPLTDKQGNRLPDGQYTYELRLTPVLSPEIRKALAESRGKDDDDAALEREMRKRGQLPSQPLVQSGTFSILNGAVIVAGGVEAQTQPPSVKTGMNLRGLSPARSFAQSEDFSDQQAAFILASAVETAASRPARKMAGQPFAHPAFPDQVIPDDAIIQGSLCVGLDCVNNESFGFDTIRLKENNTRIKFDDTSTSTGFPANDWQLTANDSASGGASKFSIEDVTGSKVPFTITAGAATNSIFVDSTGRLGLRTSTPVLDIHANTSNTPAIRLEQNNSGGFTAQTWDVAGNEANFFVRDVTGGSRLPFRIRPGAPTSSIDINASGNVGIGTASPSFHVHVLGTGIQTIAVESTQNGNNAQFAFIGKTAGGTAQQWLLGENLATTAGAFEIFDSTASQARFLINTSGNVGIGTTAPTDTLSVNGTASKPGGGSWSVFSDERLKTIKGRFTSGLNAVMQLQPIRYEYRRNNALGLNSEGEHVGFGAQALQKIIPEAVTSTSNGYLVVNNDPILWTMLNAIKEQQKEIEQLKTQLRQLQTHAGAGNRSRQRRR